MFETTNNNSNTNSSSNTHSNPNSNSYSNAGNSNTNLNSKPLCYWEDSDTIKVGGVYLYTPKTSKVLYQTGNHQCQHQVMFVA